MTPHGKQRRGARAMSRRIPIWSQARNGRRCRAALLCAVRGSYSPNRGDRAVGATATPSCPVAGRHTEVRPGLRALRLGQPGRTQRRQSAPARDWIVRYAQRVARKGSQAIGLSLISDSLMVGSLDEPATEYGLVAEWVSMPADFSSATFRLRPQARFHDGKPITPDDVVFTLAALKKANPRTASTTRTS